MRTFTIDQENNITIFASEKQAKDSEGTEVEAFTSQEELARLAGAWSGERLVQIWNSLTGVTPVKKFTDRKTAIARIWKAIQGLQPASEDGDEKAAPSRKVSKGLAARPKATRKAKASKKTRPEAKGLREGNLPPASAPKPFRLRRDGTTSFFPANPCLHVLPVRVVLGCKLPAPLVGVSAAARFRRQRH
jgi:hypothetical protein